MLFITYGGRSPKRSMTPEKLMKLLKLKQAQRKKAENIHDGFQGTQEAKDLMPKLTRSAEKVNELNAIKVSERKPGHGGKLKLAYLENSTSYLLFLKGLLDYAEANSASRLFIRAIKHSLDSAQETVIRIREKEF